MTQSTQQDHAQPNAPQHTGQTDPKHQPAHEHVHEHIGHVCPLWILWATFAGLIFLTWLTVVTSGHPEWGSWTILLALLIATAKAGLVGFYFMHLRWDNPLNGFILVTALLFVSLFIGITIIDAQRYEENITQYKLRAAEGQQGPVSNPGRTARE